MADSFFGDPFRRLLLTNWAGSSSAPMDWLETQFAHIIRINVPGLGREEVKIQLEEGNILHIKGVAKEEKKQKEKDVVCHVMERGKEAFERTLGLPDNVRADQIKAHVENEVLGSSYLHPRN